MQSPLITEVKINPPSNFRILIMNNIDPGEASVDVLALLQGQLEARSKFTVVIESSVLLFIDVAALS